jgi:hypothetical protein
VPSVTGCSSTLALVRGSSLMFVSTNDMSTGRRSCTHSRTSAAPAIIRKGGGGAAPKSGRNGSELIVTQPAFVASTLSGRNCPPWMTPTAIRSGQVTFVKSYAWAAEWGATPPSSSTAAVRFLISLRRLSVAQVAPLSVLTRATTPRVATAEWC